MTIAYHVDDLPADIDLGNIVAIDTETLGLHPSRDRLCVVQMSAGDGHCHVVHFPKNHYNAPNLVRMLNDPMSSKSSISRALISRSSNTISVPIAAPFIAPKLRRKSPGPIRIGMV